MEDEFSQKKNQSMASWILVLAIAITCCAILFYVFATSLKAINNNLAAANARLTIMEQNESQMLYEIRSLHHALTANSPEPGPPATPPQQPPSATNPPPQTPAGTTMPPPASGEIVPEVPATTH